jgi:hypothetical protein
MLQLRSIAFFVQVDCPGEPAPECRIADSGHCAPDCNGMAFGVLTRAQYQRPGACRAREHEAKCEWKELIVCLDGLV